MQPNTRSVSGQRLERLLAALHTAERAMAEAVSLVGQVAESGDCEREVGLTLDTWMMVAARSTGGDARTLLTAGDVLAGMPVTSGLFEAGRLSWGQVRGIVHAASRFGVEARGTLDGRVAATAESLHGVEGYDPDELVWAVEAAADDLRRVADVERREQRRRESSFVSVQQGFDGGVTGYFELDPLLGATVVGALDAAAGPPETSHDDERSRARDDDGSVDDWSGWSGTSRGRQYAQALGQVCGEWLGGCGDRAARPLVVADVDLRQLDAATPGMIQARVRGGLPRITAATAEALAKDADVQAVVFDGARPLAVTGKVRASVIPTDTRVAVRARDRGCRWPGCQAPIDHCDLHHLRHRSDGGTHDPDNLAALCRRHHTTAHQRGWSTQLEPDSGTLVISRAGRTYRSLPRGTPLAGASPKQPIDSMGHSERHRDATADPGDP